MSVYDFSLSADRLRYALHLLNRKQRQQWHARVKREYGEEAARELVEGLREFQAKQPR